MPYALRLSTATLATILLPLMTRTLPGQTSIEVPACEFAQQIAVVLPGTADLALGGGWQLVEAGGAELTVPAQITVAVHANGTPNPAGRRLLASIPPGVPERKTRTFRLRKADDSTATHGVFRFTHAKDVSLQLTEHDRNVLAYNYGTITEPGVPEGDMRRARGCYVHPVWGMSGEVLTADFPKDHYHHRGIFWAWPYVKVGADVYDLWVYSNIQQRFVRWLHQETGPVAAVVGVENGWFAGEKQVATERVWIVAYRSEPDCRSIDLTVAVEARGEPVTLQGREEKSYGGLTARFDVWPRTDAQVRVPGRTLENTGSGTASEQDLLNAPLPWADLASQFPQGPRRSGAAVFIHPHHPDYPPTWLTRTYGVLCVGWPGIKPHTIEIDKFLSLDYRMWIHESELAPEQIDRRYQSYSAAITCRDK
ncbi:MAG: hypothetical protein FJ276_37310 [Planctomycetes bacterium]|nr:hypothetical protein [Planctomycetota bacterium]